MPVSEETYNALLLEDKESHWELVCGQLRRKPGMTTRHNDRARTLLLLLTPQLPRSAYAIDAGSASIARSPAGFNRRMGATARK